MIEYAADLLATDAIEFLTAFTGSSDEPKRERAEVLFDAGRSTAAAAGVRRLADLLECSRTDALSIAAKYTREKHTRWSQLGRLEKSGAYGALHFLILDSLGYLKGRVIEQSIAQRVALLFSYEDAFRKAETQKD